MNESDDYRTLFQTPIQYPQVSEDEFKLAKMRKLQEIKFKIQNGITGNSPKQHKVLTGLYQDALVRKERSKLIQETALLDA
jgi:hypothetical protein